MDKVFLEFNDEKKVSAIKDKVRETLLADFLEFLNTKYERARRLSGTELGVIVGQAPDEDNFMSDIVAAIKVSVKPWYNNRDCKRIVRRFNLDEGSEYTDDDIANGLDEPNGADAYEAEQMAKNAPKK